LQCVAVCCSVLQCAAVCCSVLQCAAVCCSVLQCVAVRHSVLQCVAVCCSVLQCVAVCCSVSHSNTSGGISHGSKTHFPTLLRTSQYYTHDHLRRSSCFWQHNNAHNLSHYYTYHITTRTLYQFRGSSSSLPRDSTKYSRLDVFSRDSIHILSYYYTLHITTHITLLHALPPKGQQQLFAPWQHHILEACRDFTMILHIFCHITTIITLLHNRNHARENRHHFTWQYTQFATLLRI